MTGRDPPTLGCCRTRPSPARGGIMLRPTRASQASSSITWTPKPRALSSFEPAPGPATTMSVFFETEPATLAPSRSAIALASSRVIFSSEPVNTIVLPATGLSLATCSSGSGVTSLEQRVEHLVVVLLLEELDDGVGDDLADAADGGELGIGLRLRDRPPPSRWRAIARSCRNAARADARSSRRHGGCRARR